VKKWLIVGGFIGAAAVVLLLGALAIGVWAQGAVTPESPPGALTPDEARAVVEAAYPGATVIEVEKDDGGLAAYEVELDTGLEVRVDINTGAILSTEQEEANEATEAEDADEPGDAEDADEPGDAEDADEPGDTDDAQEAPEAKDGSGQ